MHCVTVLAPSRLIRFWKMWGVMFGGPMPRDRGLDEPRMMSAESVGEMLMRHVSSRNAVVSIEFERDRSAAVVERERLAVGNRRHRAVGNDKAESHVELELRELSMKEESPS